MISYQCICSNITFQIKPNKIETPQLRWQNPIIGHGKMEIKYNSFITTNPLGKWSLVHCNSCNQNVCLISENELIINPECKDIHQLRSKLSYSKTFDLYVDLKSIQSNNTILSNHASYVGSLSMGNINDPIEKELVTIKQKRIELLFQEKERKVRQFMIEQEEIYENERRLISEELNAIRLKLDNISLDLPKVTVTPIKQKRLKASNELFDMDEDFDDNNGDLVNNGDFDDFMPKEDFTIRQLRKSGDEGVFGGRFADDDNMDELEKTMKMPKLTFDSPNEFDEMDEFETINNLHTTNKNNNLNNNNNKYQTNQFDFDNSESEENDESDSFEIGSFSSSAQAIANAKPLKVKKEFPSTFKEYTMNSLNTNEDELPVSGSFVSTFDL